MAAGPLGPESLGCAWLTLGFDRVADTENNCSRWEAAVSKRQRRIPRAAPAADVAAELRHRLRGIGDVKLHKLLFFVQSNHLAWEGTPAFKERIEAWDMGPVVAELWRTEKYSQTQPSPSEPVPSSVSNVITNVIARFGHLSGQQLIDLTHRTGAWPEVTDHGSDVRSQTMSDDVLARHATDLTDELAELREHLAAVRDEQPFVADAPGALEELLAAHRAR